MAHSGVRATFAAMALTAVKEEEDEGMLLERNDESEAVRSLFSGLHNDFAWFMVAAFCRYHDGDS